MQKPFGTILLAAIAASLASCASPVRHTPKETAEEMSQYIENQMPAAKVRAMLGNPDNVEVDSNNATWTYHWPDRRLQVFLTEPSGSPDWLVSSWNWD